MKRILKEKSNDYNSPGSNETRYNQRDSLHDLLYHCVALSQQQNGLPTHKTEPTSFCDHLAPIVNTTSSTISNPTSTTLSNTMHNNHHHHHSTYNYEIDQQYRKRKRIDALIDDNIISSQSTDSYRSLSSQQTQAVTLLAVAASAASSIDPMVHEPTSYNNNTNSINNSINDNTKPLLILPPQVVAEQLEFLESADTGSDEESKFTEKHKSMYKALGNNSYLCLVPGCGRVITRRVNIVKHIDCHYRQLSPPGTPVYKKTKISRELKGLINNHDNLAFTSPRGISVNSDDSDEYIRNSTSLRQYGHNYQYTDSNGIIRTEMINSQDVAMHRQPIIIECFADGDDLGDLIDFSKTQTYEQLVETILARFPYLDRKRLMMYYINKENKKVKITKANFHYTNLRGEQLREIHIKSLEYPA